MRREIMNDKTKTGNFFCKNHKFFIHKKTYVGWLLKTFVRKTLNFIFCKNIDISNLNFAWTQSFCDFLYV